MSTSQTEVVIPWQGALVTFDQESFDGEICSKLSQSSLHARLLFIDGKPALDLNINNPNTLKFFRCSLEIFLDNCTKFEYETGDMFDANKKLAKALGGWSSLGVDFERILSKHPRPSQISFIHMSLSGVNRRNFWSGSSKCDLGLSRSIRDKFDEEGSDFELLIAYDNNQPLSRLTRFLHDCNAIAAKFWTEQEEKDPDRNRLFDLSGELRNKIYRYAVTQKVNIQANSNIEPGILRTSKEIRDEALAIYYYEAPFTLSAPSYDPSTVLKWYDHLRSLGVDPKKVRITLDTRPEAPNWGNVMEMMRLYHARRILCLPQGPRRAAELGKALKSHHIVGAMADQVRASLGRPFQEVETVLNVSRHLLIMMDVRWSQ